MLHNFHNFIYTIICMIIIIIISLIITIIHDYKYNKIAAKLFIFVIYFKPNFVSIQYPKK